jgi:VWFA-related protein
MIKHESTCGKCAMRRSGKELAGSICREYKILEITSYWRVIIMGKRLSNTLLGILCCSFLMAACGGGGSSSPPPSPPSPPTINLSSDNLAFGNVVLDDVSEQTIWIENTGPAGSDLVIGQIAENNSLAAPFSISTEDCSGAHLAPTQICALKIQFSPTSQGSGLSDSFDIPSNDPDRLSMGVKVSGNGRALRIVINDIENNSCPDNVSVSFSVEDKDGNPITGLQQANIAISENGNSKNIISFSEIPSPLSLSVALAIDYSDSMLPFLDNVRSSSKGFIDQLKPGDEAAIFGFSRAVVLQQPFTDNNAALKSAIDTGIGNLGGGTLVYDTLWSAIDNAAARTNNRAIVIITDGKDEDGLTDDPLSVKTLTEVINYAKEKEVAIFTIGIGVVEIDVMSQLANETGGQFYLDPDANNLVNIYLSIRSLLSGDYSATYQSPVTGAGPVLLNLFVDSNGLQGEGSLQFPGCP